MIKTDLEIEVLRYTNKISSEAHKEVRSFLNYLFISESNVVPWQEYLKFCFHFIYPLYVNIYIGDALHKARNERVSVRKVRTIAILILFFHLYVTIILFYLINFKTFYILTHL